MNIKLQTIKDALEDYNDDSHEFKAFIAGLVAGVEEANVSQVESLGGATLNLTEPHGLFSDCGIRKREVITDLLEVAEINLSTSVNGLVINPTDNSYSLVSSDLMTDDDRKQLPLNVWIKHDGKSVPVLEDGEYHVRCGWYYDADDYENGSSFKDEFLWDENYPPVTAFMIKKIGV